MITHEEYADEAESAERAGVWPQAAALYRRAVAKCKDPGKAGTYAEHAKRCDDEVAVDEAVAAIARRVLGISTLAERKSDALDFHELAVWNLRDALIAAYREGREAGRR